MTDWRWTFYINVPIALVAFVLIALYCPPLKHDKKPRVDYAGAMLLTLALGTLILAVDNTESIFKNLLNATGWSLTGLRVLMFSVVAAATAAFVWVEHKAKEPILPLSFFKNRNFMLIMGVATLFGAAFMGSILYLTQFNQQVFGATPTESGLMLLPMIAGLMLTSIGSGQIISRTGRYKIFMQIGIVLATAMVALLATLTPESTYLYEAVIMTLLGAGLGVVMPVMNLAVQNEFEQHDLGAATSSSQLFRSLGSTIGVAVFGAVLTTGMTGALGGGIQNDSYVKTLASSPVARNIGDLKDTDTLLNLNMPDTKQKITSGFESAVKDLPAPTQEQVVMQFKNDQANYAGKITHAFSDSLRQIFITSTLLMLAAAVLVFSLKEKRLHSASPLDTPGEA